MMQCSATVFNPDRSVVSRGGVCAREAAPIGRTGGSLCPAFHLPWEEVALGPESCNFYLASSL